MSYSTLKKVFRAIKLRAFRSRIQMHRQLGRQTILVQRDAGIGDIICSLPAIRALKCKYPEAYIVYSTSAPFMPIAKMCCQIDSVVDSRWAGQFQRDQPGDFDLIFRLRLEDEKPSLGPLEHIVDDFAKQVGVVISDRQPWLTPRSRTIKHIKQSMDRIKGKGPILAIHTGPTLAVKMWTFNQWASLVKRLCAEMGATVLQLGAEYHTVIGEATSQRIPGCVDWVGKLSLEETAAAISQCNQLIGIDSGLVHIAGAVGTPTVVLFGPVAPERCLPPTTPTCAVTSSVPCLGCQNRLPVLHWQSGCPFDIACMQSLTTEAVFKASVALLTG